MVEGKTIQKRKKGAALLLETLSSKVLPNKDVVNHHFLNSTPYCLFVHVPKYIQVLAPF